jgi:hypothetical protein
MQSAGVFAFRSTSYAASTRDEVSTTQAFASAQLVAWLVADAEAVVDVDVVVVLVVVVVEEVLELVPADFA